MGTITKIIVFIIMTVTLVNVTKGLNNFEGNMVTKKSFKGRRHQMLNSILNSCGPVMKSKCSILIKKCHWLTKRSIETEANEEKIRVKRRAKKLQKRRPKGKHVHVRINCNTCRNLCW